MQHLTYGCLHCLFSLARDCPIPRGESYDEALKKLVDFGLIVPNAVEWFMLTPKGKALIVSLNDHGDNFLAERN